MYTTTSKELVLILCVIICALLICGAKDSIGSSERIRDGETVVSSGGVFELGFFSPGKSSNRYLGIWYNNLPLQIVWVANRRAPLPTKSGILEVIEPGILVLVNESRGIIWSSNASRSVGNPTAQLLDTGNLVVKDRNGDGAEHFLWQSFDYPSDTYLPGMALGWNYVTAVETYLSSWTSSDDPAPGEFTLRLDPSGYPQLVMEGAKAVRIRIGPWNGLEFSGAPNGRSNESIVRTTLRMSKNEIRYKVDVLDQSTIRISKVSYTGLQQMWTWDNRSHEWAVYADSPACSSYNFCGAHGICDAEDDPRCRCLDKFVAKDEESWIREHWTEGCIRRTALNCENDVFLKKSGIRLPDSRNSTFDERKMVIEECELECSRNCSCTAYTQLDISKGSGCLFYYGELIDIGTMDQNGQDLYIRMASSELEKVAESKGKKRIIFVASFASAVGMVLLCLSLILFCTLKNKKYRNKGRFIGGHDKEAELPFFNLPTILKATNNFSIVNKLGEGGFGPVYRGLLEDGREIAVKRLSKTSSQGVTELTNEVVLIAKLQHRNLVRLLGCCVQRDENMLIYEYMSNNSLDLILFDQTKSMLLDWRKRFQIINGIARGLLYLHQDSRLRIIHRDLKASNVLLDADMNPKISDFGLARGFGGNETQAKTRRVVGTYGYMAPEYAIDGLFSIKSDVFSFGVLVLEVVSGNRNRGFSVNDHHLNLLGHAWTLYREDKSRELVDAFLGDSFDLSEALRSIHVGLLCVQKSPEDRPSMASVVFMLGNEVELPQAKPPGFFTERDVLAAQRSTRTNASISENQVSISVLEGR